MARQKYEINRFLTWLGEVLRDAEEVDVDIVVVDRPHQGSALQVTIEGLKSPLAGLELQWHGDRAGALERWAVWPDPRDD